MASDLLLSAAEEDARSQRTGVGSASFLGLLVTQFLGATNDNIFRWLIVPIGKEILGEGQEQLVLGLGATMFVLPYILFAAPAAYLADRFSKRNVIVGCKVAEVLLLMLGVAAILYGNIHVMFALLFLMGTHSAIFSPSKYGSIPEIVRHDKLAVANSLVGMTTILAIVLGTVVGGYLYDATKPAGHTNWWISAAVLLGIAGSGLIASLFVGRLRSANPVRPFPVNWAAESYRDLRLLCSYRPLILAAIGSTLFWSLGGLVQLNVDIFATKCLLVEQKFVGWLLASLAVGVGVGNAAAGIVSKGRIELGIVPLAAAGIAISGILLSTVPDAAGDPASLGYILSCVFLAFLGVAAGAYDVPLQAFLQFRSPENARGSILAATNFLTFTGMIIASALFIVMGKVLGFSGRTIFLVSGIALLPVFWLAAWLVPIAFCRLIFRTWIRLFYRLHLTGLENVPKEGGALIVANHVSWLDGLLLLAYCPRPIRMIAVADFVSWGPIPWLARQTGTILIRPGKRKAVAEAIRTARQAIANGELVGVFPEGGITRTGLTRKFQPGPLSILREGAPVVPCYLAGLWGSLFSFRDGKFFFKWPRRAPYPLAMAFGPAVHNVRDMSQIRTAVLETGDAAMRALAPSERVLPRQFLRAARRNRFRWKTADSTGAQLTGAGLLTRSLALRRVLRREVLAHDEHRVGVLLPPSVAAIVTNAALSLDRRAAVPLNYTLSSALMNECIRQAGIRHVLTSRALLERFPQFSFDAEVVCLEDVREKINGTDKILAAASAWLEPVWLLERRLGLTRIRPDDLMTIMFTSGSTGDPKGVMLSHYNLASNITAFEAVLDLKRDDIMLGILPFFHSFGYTTALWSVLALDLKVVYHYSPLEPRPIAQLCRKHKVNVMPAAPTFLRTFLRRCDPADLASLSVVVTGSEKLPTRVADEFERKFGVRPLEGYGTTELSPVVSVNIPPSRMKSTIHPGNRAGSVGQPIPGVAAKVISTETGEVLGFNQSGLLLIKGPNVMLGYLNQPEATARAIHDGWYSTGDIAEIDADGFIKITGRQSRFSKIGGEMVPHLAVEEAIGHTLSAEDAAVGVVVTSISESAADAEENRIRLVVTAVADARKGERLVVLHTGMSLAPAEVCHRLIQDGLPPLWTPAPDAFIRVDAIPTLGSGKLDIRAAKTLAETLLGTE